jgi:hypothetical protein
MNVSRRFCMNIGAALAVLTAVVASSGCSSADQNLILMGGKPVDPSTIDKDPMALLPRNPVLLGYLDAAEMFRSNLGSDVNQIVTMILPLGPESNFVPARDVKKVYGGIYAMQGADFCAVLQGDFDVESIRRAAEARTMVASKVPLVRSRYSDLDLYTAGNVGFVVLTGHTVLSGNETGMRRAVDRLRRDKLERSLPKWMADLSNTPGAAFTIAGDFGGDSAVDAATQKMPFLVGLRKVRTIGNFKDPGMNIAGSFTYSDTPSAAAGAVQLADLQKLTGFMSLLSSLGLIGTVPTMHVEQRDNDLGITMPVDTSFARFMLGTLKDLTSKATSGVPPTGTWAWPLLNR